MSSDVSTGDSNSKTSLTLIDRAIGRSEDAWDEMMRIYFPLIRFWARGAGLNEHDAENVCQEVFVRLIRFLARFQPTKPVGSSPALGATRNFSTHPLCHWRFPLRKPLPMTRLTDRKSVV